MHRSTAPRTLFLLLLLTALNVASPQIARAAWWPYPFRISELHTEAAVHLGRVSHYTIEVGKGKVPLTARITLEMGPMSPYRSGIYMDDRQGNVMLQRNFAWHVYVPASRDLDGDNELEFVVSYSGDTLAGVRAYSSVLSSDTLWEYVLLESNCRWRQRLDKWDVYFEIGPVVKLSGDRNGLLLLCQSGFCQLPRGLIMLDAATGEEIWREWCGGNNEYVHEVTTQDGQRLIVVSTSSSGNGAVWEGTDDMTCYLYALRPETGELVWRRSFQGMFSHVMFQPITDSLGTTRELVAVYISSPSKETPAALMRVDPRDGSSTQEKIFPERQFTPAFQFWKSPSDDSWRVYLTSLPSELQVFDNNFELIGEKSDVTEVLCCGDWELPVGPELLVTSVSGKTLYLNESLHEKALLDFKSYRITEQYFPDQVWPELITTDGTTIKRLRVEPNPFYWREVGVRIVTPLVLSVTMAWLIVWGVRTRRAYVRARNEKLVLEGWAQTASFQAHDTKKPIAVVQRAVENLELRLRKEHPEFNVEPFVRRMKGEISRMLQTSRQIQVISRVTKPNLQQTNLSELIATTVDRMNTLEQVPVVHVNPDRRVDAQIDYRLVESLLENLIGNAMDATLQEGGSVRVMADYASGNGGGVEVTVLDNGKGMTAQEIEDILNWKGSRKAGGQGLGLLSAKWIAETHHGSLHIESQPGMGTKITVHLPGNGGPLSPAKTSS